MFMRLNTARTARGVLLFQEIGKKSLSVLQRVFAEQSEATGQLAVLVLLTDAILKA